jgi:tRNA(Ile)-lysidine synthetase-like protein
MLARRVADAVRALGIGSTDPIGVACSGGADSVALLHLVAGRGNVTVLHVDHHLRDDSALDAAFVRAAAGALDLPCDVIDVHPANGSEAAAREARYRALEDMARERGLRWVLTAHTRDDQAETVLLRLMRGDTLDAIAPLRGTFVRPLLDVTRGELREWLTANRIEWREDPTNTDDRFERNWVRGVLLPQMRDRRPGLDAVLARTADRARDDALALDAIATGIVAQAPSDDAGVFVPAADRLPSGVVSRVIRAVCRRLGHDPSAHDVDAIRTMRSHVRCGDVDAWRLDDGLAFTRAPIPVPEPVDVPATGRLDSIGWGVTIRTTPSPRLRIRSRRDGDRVRTSAGTRKVQDVLVDAKVPRLLRSLVPILADDDGALAVVGGRVPSAALVGAEPYRQTWSRQRAWIG